MLLLTLFACTGADPEDTAAEPIVDDGCVHPLWEGGYPFPSNRLVTRDASSPTGVRLAIDEGILPLSRKDLVPLDVTWFEGLDGFSRLAPVVVQLDTKVDPTAFGALSSDGTAPLAILDVDAATFVPGRLSVTDDGSTLTVWPDAALRESALHAIVLRSDLPTDTCFSAGPALLAVEQAGDEHADEMAAARTAAVSAGLAEADVAAVIPFTTRSSAGEFATMRSIEAQAPGLVDPSGLDASVTDCAVGSHSSCGEGVGFVVEGTAALPTWQGADWEFVTDGDGVPTVQSSEAVDFWLFVPESARVGEGAAPAPLIVLQHGLGGTAEGLAGFGERLVAAGYAVVAIDAVAHGDRPHEDDTTLTFFGIDFDRWLVAVARDNIRQTAADHLALRALLDEAGAAGAFADFAIDGTNAAYVGQSLGGIIGATTCAADTGLDRCVLNVPGARLVEVVRENAAYATLMNIYFDPSDQQAEIELFSALAQTVVDPADPGVNGRRILGEAPGRPVLVQEATHDETVVNQTTEVLARSMGIPLLRPALEDIRGIDGADMPVQGNVPGVDGDVTAGLTQFDEEHSFLTYDGGEEAERALRQLLTFLSEGRIEASAVGE